MGDLAIGIDLGTTYCCMAVYRDGDVEIIPNDVGSNTTPSFVHFDQNNYVTAGPTARGVALDDPKRAVYDVKRLIGRRFNDPLLQKDMEIWPFQVVQDEDTDFSRLVVNEKSYVPEQISAHVLEYLKKCAEEWLDCPINKAVITVPAYFSKEQRHATKIAGTLAGLEVLKLLHEPTAAAVTYFYKKKSFETEKTVLVFDLGGGTFDVVVMTIKNGSILIKAIGGDSHLGGQDIDRNLVDYCVQEFKTKNGIDLNSVGPVRDEFKVARLLRRLKNECEEKKIQLSHAKQLVISLDSVHGDLNLTVKITREKFETLNDRVFQQCVNTVKSVVEEAKLAAADIDEVIMVGGSSRIPKLQELIMGLFQDKKPNKTINADEAVACGAAIQAALMTIHCSALKNIFPDIKIRDAISSSADAKPFTTVVTNTPYANSVNKDDWKSQIPNSTAQTNRQVVNLKSDGGKEIPKPILRKTNEVEKPDEILAQLEIITNNLMKKEDRAWFNVLKGSLFKKYVEEISDAWKIIWLLTDGNPGNCERFLEHRGIKLFLKCLIAFPNDVDLKRRSLRTLINVAEVEHLRPQLMTSELINVVCNFLDSTEDSNWISYFAACIIILILSDGVAAWTVKSPRRADVLSGIRRSVKRCEEDQSTYCWLSGFIGLYIKLLNVTHTTECQLFAAWSLKNLTKDWPNINVPALVKQGGLDILNKMRCEDEDVRKYVNMAIKEINDYLSRN